MLFFRLEYHRKEMALIMKKWLIALLTLLALSLSVAFAAEANDITEDCKF